MIHLISISYSPPTLVPSSFLLPSSAFFILFSIPFSLYIPFIMNLSPPFSLPLPYFIHTLILSSSPLPSPLVLPIFSLPCCVLIFSVLLLSSFDHSSMIFKQIQSFIYYNTTHLITLPSPSHHHVITLHCTHLNNKKCIELQVKK